MSLSLPPEILDLIVDHLHDETATLRACCLVSGSWIPRSRIHLFDHVEFRSSGRTLESWMKTFPDPSNSPAYWTRSLCLSHSNANSVAIADCRPWVHSFNNIADLQVAAVGYDQDLISLTQLHGLSPSLRSLRLFHSNAPLSEVLALIFSFPLLEDLALRSLHGTEKTDEWDAPPTSPKFTGSLDLRGSNRYVTRKLLELPGGLHFSKIKVFCPIGDGDLASELVSKCSDTLEFLLLEFYRLVGMPGMPSLNLSEATKLKDVDFRPCGPNVKWVTTALKTIRSDNLQQITINFITSVPLIFLGPISEATRREWQDLDHLLVRLWTTRSIRPVLIYDKRGRRANDPVVLVPKLLPELAIRGVIDVG